VLPVIIALAGLFVAQPVDDKTVVDRAVFELSLRDFVRGRLSMRRE